MRKNVLNFPRLLELKKSRRKLLINKILLSVLALLVIFSSLAYISRLAGLNISSVEITGNKVIDTETIKTIVEKEIQGKYWWFFPKTNILFYPKNNIKNELSNKFKRLKDINFSIRDRKVLIVSMAERVGLYIWCGTALPETNTQEQKCYFLDKDGYIFDEAPYFSGEVYFKFYGETVLNNDGIPSESYFFPDIFSKLTLFKETLETMGLKPVASYVENNGNIKILLARKTSATGPEIIFKADADFQKLAENLQAALTTEPLQSNFDKKYQSLLYIDLRFGNKVYYKFK